MNPPARKLPWTIIIGLILLLLTLALAFIMAEFRARLAASRPLPILSQLADFTLTNQAAKAVSLADLRGHVWVADIIFTSCGGPCPRMTGQMKSLQDALPPSSQARLVTLTTDPDHDTTSILKTYGERFDADPKRWMFLTGTKKEIGGLAADGLKLSAVEVPPADRQAENDLFIHSTLFVVVDKQARLRGVFETSGEGVDWPVEKKKILAAIRQLELEP